MLIETGPQHKGLPRRNSDPGAIYAGLITPEGNRLPPTLRQEPLPIGQTDLDP
jgi:hypothetical protein